MKDEVVIKADTPLMHLCVTKQVETETKQSTWDKVNRCLGSVTWWRDETWSVGPVGLSIKQQIYYWGKIVDDAQQLCSKH